MTTRGIFEDRWAYGSGDQSGALVRRQGEVRVDRLEMSKQRVCGDRTG